MLFQRGKSYCSSPDYEVYLTIHALWNQHNHDNMSYDEKWWTLTIRFITIDDDDDWAKDLVSQILLKKWHNQWYSDKASIV